MTTETTQTPTPLAATRTKSASSITTAEGIYPDGHLGHLSEKHSIALEKFREYLTEKGIYKPGPPPSHSDGTLLRFLRARRWVVEDGYKQLKDFEDWRTANDIDVLYRTIDLDSYESSRRLYPQWTGRRDRRGIPLYVFAIKALDNKAVNAYEKAGKAKPFSEAKVSPNSTTPQGMMRLFALYENLTGFATPFCTQLPDRLFPDVPITMSTNIVDISGVGLKQFWDLKNHMQAASQLATANYPETLDRIFIIGAPVFFSTVWGWIKRWFDPITVSKIFILSPHEVLPTLEQFIDKKNIPKKYGGELDYTWGELATVDPAWEGRVEFQNGFNGFPSGPMRWEEIEGGEKLQCILLGSKDGVKLSKVVCTMPKTWIPKRVTPEDEDEEEVVKESHGEEVVTGASSEKTAKEDGSVDEGADALEKLKIEEQAAPVTTAPATTA